MGDQQYLRSICTNSAEAHAIAFNHRAGCISSRSADGVADCKPDGAATMTRDNGAFPRLWAHSLLEEGIAVIDRTMVVDVALSPAGETAGVVAIDLISGNARVIRSKAVVMAAGTHCWTFGKCSNGAHSMGGPECTGDAFSIFLKHGAEVVNMEQLVSTPTQFYPDGIGYTVGSLYAGVMSWNLVCDADGNTYAGMLTGGQEVDNIAAFPTFGGQPARMMLRALYDQGAIYCITDEMRFQQRYLKRVQENLRKFIGYTCPEVVEVDPDIFESAGHPLVDTDGESTIPNLFWAGSGEGSWRGISSTYSIGSGHMAGKGAALRASDTEIPEIDWEGVGSIIDECYGLLQRDSSTGKSALEVSISIQNVMHDGCFPIRTEEGLKAAIAELERIREEDLPTMHVRTGSKLFNTEWRQALEVPNMWNSVMATAQSALARTETRGCHVRLDYPSLDHENWLKYVVVSTDGSKWNVSTREFDTSIVSTSEIKEMLAGDSSMFDDVVIHS
jgi:succinate dehydrogenase / fumarate reductase flavoprotein subunit